MPYKNPISAIYIITCIVNNKHYIGKTHNYFHRIGQHKLALERDKHHSYHLQKAYNKYGKDNFMFEILEEYPRELLISLENYWVNMLNSCSRKYGYNMTQPINQTKLYKKRSPFKMSDEQKEKLRQINLGKPKNSEVIDKLVNGVKSYRKTDKYKQDIINTAIKNGTKVVVYNYITKKYKIFNYISLAADYIGSYNSRLSVALDKASRSVGDYLIISEKKFNKDEIYTKQKRNRRWKIKPLP